MSVHPARFSKPIVDVIRDILVAEFPGPMGRPVVHDPFAGTGTRLAEICDTGDGLGFGFSGTEIEECFIEHEAIIHGDACDARLYPPTLLPNETTTGGWVICTSPVYANGVADNHKPSDASKRHTYRAAKIEITGDPDAELHPGNMGNYGYRSTQRDGKSTKRKAFWEIADAAMSHWDSALLAIVNVSDFKAKRNGVEVTEPHVDDWKALLYKHGWINQTDFPVGTQRQGNGENRDVRVANEVVLVCRRSA